MKGSNYLSPISTEWKHSKTSTIYTDLMFLKLNVEENSVKRKYVMKWDLNMENDWQ